MTSFDPWEALRAWEEKKHPDKSGKVHRNSGNQLPKCPCQAVDRGILNSVRKLVWVEPCGLTFVFDCLIDKACQSISHAD
jgi:hypothetical protein